MHEAARWRIDRRSVNFSSREGAAVFLLVMHYTGMRTAEEALGRLCEAQAKVSAHYVVGEDGTIWNLVDEAHCAWHAGVSFWRGRRNVNEISIGIEIVNPGHEWGYQAFPMEQMQAVAALSRGILARHAIAAQNVVAHSDVAPMRKEDPGELFDWEWLASQGVGVWPEGQSANAANRSLARGDSGGEVAQMQGELARYGYDVPQHGDFDSATEKTVIAFQRHFRPSIIGGIWDAECAGRLQRLLDAVSSPDRC